MPQLFSYGTLQLPNVQFESLGRVLSGVKDSLGGYKLVSLEINDEVVLQQSGKVIHPMAVPTGDPKDRIEGMLFEVSEQELLQADSYEVDDYVRVEVKLESGERAWIFVSAGGERET